MGCSLTVKLKTKSDHPIFINYIHTNDLIYSNYPNIYIGLGVSNVWRKVTRNIKVDFYKGVALFKNSKARQTHFLGIQKISLLGSGIFDLLTF